ncbi:hypothetical protein [Paenibacillus chitinolyticus]|uniref:hypothetical protein n=1 Tax=Paenibacillus chitinolyticus TaxID=79263 RepID=UPI001C46245B|nr:hypothetical protein [Paenibacillus chitinolyticus]MBV6717159.1 hypothetical protein [Paenibacillus chitinolyticus]
MKKSKAPYISNGIMNVPDIRIEYKGYIIQPKLDFGKLHWIVRGNDIRRGYVVTDGGVNVMPGATWYCSTIEARVAIDTLVEAKETAADFWMLWDEKSGRSQWEDI